MPYTLRGAGTRWFRDIVERTFGGENIATPPPSGEAEHLTFEHSVQPVLVVNDVPDAPFASPSLGNVAVVNPVDAAGDPVPLVVEGGTGPGGDTHVLNAEDAQGDPIPLVMNNPTGSLGEDLPIAVAARNARDSLGESIPLEVTGAEVIRTASVEDLGHITIAQNTVSMSGAGASTRIVVNRQANREPADGYGDVFELLNISVAFGSPDSKVVTEIIHVSNASGSTQRPVRLEHIFGTRGSTNTEWVGPRAHSALPLLLPNGGTQNFFRVAVTNHGSTTNGTVYVVYRHYLATERTLADSIQFDPA